MKKRTSKLAILFVFIFILNLGRPLRSQDRVTWKMTIWNQIYQYYEQNHTLNRTDDGRLKFNIKKIFENYWKAKLEPALDQSTRNQHHNLLNGNINRLLENWGSRKRFPINLAIGMQPYTILGAGDVNAIAPTQEGFAFLMNEYVALNEHVGLIEEILFKINDMDIFFQSEKESVRDEIANLKNNLKKIKDEDLRNLKTSIQNEICQMFNNALDQNLFNDLVSRLQKIVNNEVERRTQIIKGEIKREIINDPNFRREILQAIRENR